MAGAQTGKRRIWLTGLLVLVALLCMGGAAWWFLLPGGRLAATTHGAPGTAATISAKPMYYNLEPFTVNLKSGEFGDRLLYVGITLDLPDDATRQRIQEYLPQVRNRLLMVLSGQDASSLISSDGKQSLAELIRDALNQPLADGRGALRVDGVLFTQFIVQ